MRTDYIPILQHGGIGDQIAGASFAKLFRHLGLPVKVYTLYPEVAMQVLPWAEIGARTDIGVDRPAWYIELTDVVKFTFRRTDIPMHPAVLPFYDALLAHQPEWGDLIARHPSTCNEIGIKAVGMGLHRWDLCHYLVGQPYKPSSVNIPTKPGDYFTVHDGFDSSHSFDVSMKSWSVSHWEELVELLKPHGPVYQVGGPKHRLIRNVSKNFAGKMSFHESVELLSASRLHIDGDSGLVHARHLFSERPSVVLFGPTNPDYFGYPENLNIRPNFCGGCWWTKRNWMKQCVKELPGDHAQCMTSIKPLEVYQCIVTAGLHILSTAKT